MEYDSIILELLSRVQKLESEVKELKEGKKVVQSELRENGFVLDKNKSYTEQACDYIRFKMKEAEKAGEKSVILRAGDIEKAIGLSNRVVVVCNAMRKLMKDNDRIVEQPPSGLSTKVRIEYFIK